MCRKYKCFCSIHSVKKVLRYWSQIDLATLTGTFVASFTVVIFAREIYGPFRNVSAVQLAQFVPFAAFHSLLLCILSLQLTQVTFVLKPFLLTDVSISKLALTHRCTVAVASVIFGYNDLTKDMLRCEQLPVCQYFFGNQMEEPATPSSSNLNLSTLVFLVLLVACQV